MEGRAPHAILVRRRNKGLRKAYLKRKASRSFQIDKTSLRKKKTEGGRGAGQRVNSEELEKTDNLSGAKKPLKKAIGRGTSRSGKE